MTKLLQVGMSSAAELHDTYGHIACTLGGVNYESRGSKGCIRGSSARGATSPLFKHTFHLVLSEAAAKKAKKYADSCVGHRYVLGQVPSAHQGGDCSGFISGIICVARGERIKRLFTTATWQTRFDDSDVGFSKGLGGGVATSKITAIGRPDRPFPGVIFTTRSPKSDHVKWIQSRLNCAAKGKHPVLGGQRLAEDRDFGPDTRKVVRAFQQHHDLEVDGKVGRHTWHQLLAVH